MNQVGPYTSRDFSKGRYSKNAVSPALTPENSVANSINILYDQIIGSAVVRPGTTVVGTPITGSYGAKESVSNDDDFFFNYDSHLTAQTFTPGSSYTLGGVKLKLYEVGTLVAYSMLVYIVPTTAGVPQSILNAVSVSAFMDARTLSATSGPGATSYFVPMAPVALVAGTTYAIVVRQFGGDVANYVAWRASSSGTGAFTSTNTGTSWTTAGNFATIFTTYSVTAADGQSPLGYNVFPSQGSNINDLIAIFDLTNSKPAALIGTAGKNGVLFYYNQTQWRVGYVGIDTTGKTRMAVLGGRLFLTNAVDGMVSTTDPNNIPDTTDCITTNSVKPTLIFRSKNRLLASGYSGFTSRIYFSSIIDPNATPFLTWSTDPSTGDWIDINPNDGGYIIGFIETPSSTLVIKTNGFYRLDSISRTVTPDAISPIGAISQEGIANCQGTAYIFSGTGIWRTNGDVPELISRLGVQDFIDAIPQANWANVALGADDFNVYASIGDITINSHQDNERSLSNVVLKFSVRDQSWSIHSYGDEFRFFSQYLTTQGYIFTELDLSGNSQRVNYGLTDNSRVIYFELETQDLEFGNRSHLKEISNKISVFLNYGLASQLQIAVNGGEYKKVNIDLNNRVSVSSKIAVKGYFFNLKWFGESDGKAPIFEGFSIPDVIDKGVVNKNA